ncbi:uncharacterized protein FPRO_15586 [Fusarium proliferatum ET1]|uniref:Uncharacterized protein n=1 Tax=Fusarium proliferatum (strain ET1) TaxID=1227346 RepID=A0A1L7VXS5_FUSPR|nr:uncharacterized protein FPRO_15586 [Fusarium proliferatum ET1]CZR45239.1 uncharacterized protein FPRO_15586 [Fusarium proliferatum ET1]
MAIETTDTMPVTINPTSWLQSLPTEVLQFICAHLCRHCQDKTLIPHFELPLTDQSAPDRDTTSANAETLKDLCALSRVSRRLRDVAQPILYHEFPSLELRERRLEPFLQTVIARPDLAKVVKTLAFNSSLANYLDINLARGLYQQGLKVLGTDVNKVWRSRCENNLQLRLHKALHAFLFGGDENTPDQACQLMFASAEILVLLLCLLPNLTTLMVDGLSIVMFVPPSAFEVFGISSIKIRRLYATRLPRPIVDVAPDLDELAIGPRGRVRQESRPGSISYWRSDQELNQHIRSPQSEDIQDVEQMITSCKQPLRSFRYDLREVKRHIAVPFPSISFLHDFRTTLESLRLDFRVRSVYRNKIRSLKKFINLKDLFITTNLIYYSTRNRSLGPESPGSLTCLLPNNIEKLTLVNYSAYRAANDDLHVALTTLAVSMRQGYFPRLALVEVLRNRAEKQLIRKIYRGQSNRIHIEGGTWKCALPI